MFVPSRAEPNQESLMILIGFLLSVVQLQLANFGMIDGAN